MLAVDDFSSFEEAESILTYLMEDGYCREKAVILVANKTDLVRNRTVSHEGRCIALSIISKSFISKS